MKNMIMVIVSAILGVITLMIVMTVNGRMNRSMEIKSGSLSSSVEKALELMTQKSEHDIQNAEEYIFDFVEGLSGKFDTDLDVLVEVDKLSEERGLMSVRVMEEYIHPNGNQGTVECSRTVILDKVEEMDQVQYTVRFYMTKEDLDAAENCYKMCQVLEGEMITVPAGPKKAGESFNGWRDAEGNAADVSLPITENAVYYAEWHYWGAYG